MSGNKPAPLYERVKQYVTDGIAAGAWEVGEKLPSENELAAALSVSRLTVHRALRELAADGAITRLHGVGSFVAPPRPVSSIVRVHNIADVIRTRGDTLSARVEELKAVRAGASLGRHFGLPSEASLFHSLVVYFANGEPLQIEDRYVLPSFAPDYLRQDFLRMSTTDYLQSIEPPTKASNVIEAALPSPREAALLDIGSGEPCLVITRTTWVRRELTTFTRFIHPGSRHRIVSDQAEASGARGDSEPH